MHIVSDCICVEKILPQSLDGQLHKYWILNKKPVHNKKKYRGLFYCFCVCFGTNCFFFIKYVRDCSSFHATSPARYYTQKYIYYKKIQFIKKDTIEQKYVTNVCNVPHIVYNSILIVLWIQTNIVVVLWF